MEPSARSEAVISLGKRLVEQLELGEGVDILSRWLAHVLAEKISAAEGIAQGAPERSEVEKETIDLILRLWEHRRDFRSGARPFEELEPLAAALQILNPEAKRGLYLDPLQTPRFESANPAPKEWLQRAIAVDRAAQDAVRYCLLAAYEAEPGSGGEWADLASKIGRTTDAEVVIVRLLGFEDERFTAAKAAAARQKKTLQTANVLSDAGAAITRHAVASFGNGPDPASEVDE